MKSFTKTESLSPETQKERIRAALERGRVLTSYDANMIGRTVDARKYISDLRREGVNISDDWSVGDNGRRFKIYFIARNA